MKIRSPVFDEGQRIPRRYTCEGNDLSPELTWSGAPEGTKSLVLILEDPDAPDPAAPKRMWVHWVVYDLPVTTTGLPEGGLLPAGARAGSNDWNRKGYGGPCPPIGRHRYYFRLYALKRVLGDIGAPTRAELMARIERYVLGKAHLMGTYAKGD